MPSWRESDPEPTKPVKPAKSSKPAKPATQPSPAQSALGRQTDWRGRQKTPTVKSSSAGAHVSTKDWLASDSPEAGPSRSTIRKWVIVSLLFTAFVATTTILIQQLFFKLPKLPLYAICVGEYPSVPELRENPFGNYQRKQVEAINQNYVLPYARTLNGNDHLLGLLKSKDWLSSLQLPADLVKLGRPVTAYYINCFAKIDHDSIELYHQSSTPFVGGDSEARSSINLQTLLENLAGAATKKKDQYLWVILDLQLPHTISALGDLSPRWRTAVENTLARVKSDNPDHPDWYDRLVVTIPANDGQNSWLAPEYSASFFSYHLFKLLDTPQKDASLVRRILGSPLTLDEFQSNLNRRVSEDVASRRFAVQQPVWLPEENVQKFNSIGLVGGSQGSFQSTAVGDLAPRSQQIQELWKKLDYEILRDAYRWDPVGYAKVESQLLALEEISQYQPDSFAAASRDVEQSLGRLMSPTVVFGASLIEDAQRAEYFWANDHAEQLIGKTKIDSIINQGEPLPFWRKASDSHPETAPEEMKLSDNEKLRLVWEAFSQAATNDSSSWTEVFQLDRLSKAMEYLELNYESDRPPPIEIYLLQRLRDDLDWQKADVGPIRAEACAKLIATFEILQTIATDPEPMLARWLLEPLRTAEADFLLGFDWLMAGGFQESIGKFNSCRTQLQILQVQAENVAVGIESAQETLWIAPHALAWLLREYQFSEDTQSLDRDLGELGQAVHDSMFLYKQMSLADRQLSQLVVEGAAMRNRLATLQQKFHSYVESKTDFPSTSAASRSSQTYRRNRIALMCPLLTLGQRTRLHQNVAAYLGDVGSGSSAAAEFSLTEQRALDAAVQTFLRPLNAANSDQRLHALWSLLASGDLRYGLLEQMSGFEPALTSDDSTMRRTLLEAELWLRVMSFVIGDTPTLQAKTDSQNSWPFSAACLRWKLAETERCVWQVARMAEAGWGHGSIPSSDDPNRFYFGQLGGRYLSQTPNLANAAASERAEQLLRNGQKRLVERAQSLNRLSVRFGNERQTIGDSDTVAAPIVVTGSSWKAVAAAYLGNRGQLLPWQLRYPEDRVLAIPLDMASETTEKYKDFSTNWASGKPIGNLAVRGNYRIGPIEWRSEAAPYIGMELKKELKSDAEIYVDAAGDAPVMNVVLLLDCSNSMRLIVDAMVETEAGSAGRSQIPLFDQVALNVKRVINELAQAHDRREADIQVCLIPFGIGHYKSLKSGFLKEFLSEQRVTAKPTPPGEWGHFYASKSFLALNEDGRLQLERVIDELAGENKVDTPLYDAVREACARIRRKQGESSSAVSQILVFSDGVHYVNERSPYDGVTTPAMLLQDVSAAQTKLNIFYYNHFKAWVRKSPQNKNEEFWQGVENRGVRELEDLNVQSEQIDFVKSSDAAELVRESLETIPRTNVQVVSLQSNVPGPITVESSRTGFQARIPSSLLPGTFEITSTGTRGGAKQRVDLVGGERIELRLSSRGSREFGFPAFDPDISQSGWRAPTQRQRSGGGFLGNVWFSPDWSRPLSFVWMTRHQEHPKKFTTRPKLVVGMISNSMETTLRPFLLADSYFEPGNHYPKLRFATTPWSDQTKLTKAQLTLWASDDLPGELRVEKIPQDALENGVAHEKAEITWKRSGSNLTVDVHYGQPPSLEDRLVVLCPRAESASRKLYTETSDENYVFTWTADPPAEPVDLLIMTIGQLRFWVEKGLVTEFSIDQVDTVH